MSVQTALIGTGVAVAIAIALPLITAYFQQRKDSK